MYVALFGYLFLGLYISVVSMTPLISYDKY
jgi:hypothetical protein